MAQAVEASAHGPVTLVGRGGVGTTAVAGAVVLSMAAQAAGARVFCLRADPAMEVPDLLRAVGIELGVWPPSDPVAVAVALQNSAIIILIDDADLAVAALGPVLDLPARFVLTSRRALAGTSVPVAALGDVDLQRLLPPDTAPEAYAGLPAAARLGRAVAGRPFAAVDALPPGAEVEIAIPCGVPEGRGIAIAEPFRVPIPGRIVARRCVREALALPVEPSSESLSAVMRGRREDARTLAAGLRSGIDVEDLLFYSMSGKRVADPDLAAYAAAAAARLHLRLGEPDRAATVVGKALKERPPGDRIAHGLLHWLAGDAALEVGDGDGAHESHKLAIRSLQEGGWRRGVSLLARSAAARWAATRNASRTRRWLAEARDATVLRDEPAAWAEGLRIAGDLAAVAGEVVSAGTLYDEAMAAVDRGSASPACAVVRAHVLCGQAAIETSRGDTGSAEELLTAAERVSQLDTDVRAVISFRRAELAARRGRPEDAERHAKDARAAFIAIGDGSGVRAVATLLGDLSALAGRGAEAMRTWQSALDQARRAKDTFAARRLLARIAKAAALNAPRDDLTRALDLTEVMLRS